MINNIDEDIKLLKSMNDGYTFQDCRVCTIKHKYDEEKGVCKSKECDYLNAIENVLTELEIKDKMIDLLIDKLFDLDYEHNFQKVICDYIPKAKCDTYEDDKCDICVKEYIRNEVLKDE